MSTMQSRAVIQQERAQEYGWGPLFVVLAGTFMTFLDFFIVNVALPSVQHDLHAGPAAIQLVVAGYGLTFAAGMITGGRLGDLYGRRRMFAIGLALFTVTSAACGLAPSATFLVIARVVQGAAGAMMTPQVLAILSTVYSGERRAKAFAIYGMVMGIAGVLGQLLGGLLIQADVAGSSWRGIFLINVPVGIGGVLLAGRVVPESHGERSQLDLFGTALATLGLAAFFFVLALYLQDGRGFSALFSGVVFTAVGVGFFAAMLLTQAMTTRLGKQILALGALVTAAGSVLMALTRERRLGRRAAAGAGDSGLRHGNGAGPAVSDGTAQCRATAGQLCGWRSGHVPAGRRRGRGGGDRDGALRSAAHRIVPARFYAEHGAAGRTHRPYRRAGAAAAVGGLCRLLAQR